MEVIDIKIFHIGLVTVFRIDNGIDHIKIIENTRKKSEGTGEIHLNIEQRFNRTVKAVDEGHRSRNGADFQSRIKPFDDEKTAGKVDQQWSDLGKHPHDDTEPLAASLFPHGNLGGFFIDSDELVVFLFFTGEELDKKGTAHTQGFIDELVHLVIFLLTLGEKLETRPADSFGGEHQQRDDDDADDYDGGPTVAMKVRGKTADEEEEPEPQNP